MPKRNDIKSVLIIGAGPIVIGQACEFDYSGAQACKALKEEGIRVILINSNPATIMTDPMMADATYIEPIEKNTIERIIEIEKPDAILPTMGGQTALNATLELFSAGILKKHNIEIIGAKPESINKAEDRELFKQSMSKIGLESAIAKIAKNIEEAELALDLVGLPAIIRPSFTLGGEGGGIAYNKDEFLKIVLNGLKLSPTSEVLIEESLLGWKEYEMEVVRDQSDNCIIICSIENVDPMGVHTGDSITVAPALTLTDKEYQRMRNASIAVLREIGVDTGGSNVQFALNPTDGRLIVIEMNPRVSRSSALASKATGFPIAKIAAKLAIGYTLDELKNDITKSTPASFEPTIDYVVTKIPRFTFEKFPGSENYLTTSMKSVGEVMAIGRSFQESLQKALRSLEIGLSGLNDVSNLTELEMFNNKDKMSGWLSEQVPERILRISTALRNNITVGEISKITRWDNWFLQQISGIIKVEEKIKSQKLSINSNFLRNIKSMGFSDKRISELTGLSPQQIHDLRYEYKIFPSFKRVDTCAAEFYSETAYLYSTYEQDENNECEVNPSHKKKVIILGGGPNRIGQGIEFDYCCVHAAYSLSEAGYETIMVNCNPETVSTDYDTSDRLYFEPITLEDVIEIVELEKPEGLIVQYGGQTPLKLANELDNLGVPILGTSPDQIDLAEDRERFLNFVEKYDLSQPPNGMASNETEAIEVANLIGFPLVVRPSYVLGGRAMEIVYDEDDLKKYLSSAFQVNDSNPVLLDRFLDVAIEFDVEAISDGKEFVICGILQHIEQAGVHSGDSACSIPPYDISKEAINKIEIEVEKVISNMKIIGLVNVQLAYVNNNVFILEVNPRASRTIPFVSKALGIPLARVAAKVMAGKSLKDLKFQNVPNLEGFFVKEAVMPFNKFQNVDPILGPEMRSTGEVMGIGNSFAEAFEKAEVGAGVEIPKEGSVFISVRDTDKQFLSEIVPSLVEEGFNLIATKGTASVIKNMGFKVSQIKKVIEGRPNIVDLMKNKEVNLVINTTEGRESILDSASIRRTALDEKICCTTTIKGAKAICEVITKKVDWSYRKLQDI